MVTAGPAKSVSTRAGRGVVGELTVGPGGQPPVVQVRVGGRSQEPVTGLALPPHHAQVLESEGQLTQDTSRVRYRLGKL